jgi:hypothetical protein
MKLFDVVSVHDLPKVYLPYVVTAQLRALLE